MAVSFTLVVPARDEEAFLAEGLARLEGALDGLGRSWEMIVVENGSRDATGALLEARAGGRLRVLRLPAAGRSEALRAGVAAARGELVACCDFDHYDLSWLGRALALLESGRARAVAGSKRAPGARDGRSWGRRLLSAAVGRLLGADVHGPKAARRADWPAGASSELYDLSALAAWRGYGEGLAVLPIEVRELRSSTASWSDQAAVFFRLAFRGLSRGS